MERVNLPMLTQLLKEIKEDLPDVNIWLWTSKSFEDVKELELMQFIDVLVDGKFEQELYSPLLRFRGSSNQRVIDIKKSLQTEQVKLLIE